MDPSGGVLVVRLGTGMSGAHLQQVQDTVAAAAQRGRDVVCLVEDADLAVVDALARFELLRRRRGLRGRVQAAEPGSLAELLDLAGLTVPLSGGQVLGEAEPREQ